MFTNLRRSRKLITFFTLFFVVSSLVGWNSTSFGNEQKAVVTGSYVNIRSGPGTSYAKLDSVYKNDNLTVLDKKNDWYKVKTPKGKTGWIAGWLISLTKATVAPVVKVDWSTYERLGTVTGSSVNLRGGPSTSYSIVTNLTKGAQLGINEEKGDWYNVTLSNGSKGWIAGWLINVTNNPNFKKPGGSASKPSTPTTPSSGDTGDSNNTSGNQTAVVIGDKVNVRTGPGTSYAKVTQVKQGETYAVTETKNGWHKLKLSGNKVGWIAGWLVQIKQSVSTKPESNPKPSQVGVVSGTSVNVRMAPNTSSDILGKVKKGDQLNIWEEKDGWYKISTSTIKEGWIAGWLVEVKKDEKVIQISLTEKSGAPILTLAGNEKLVYAISENHDSLEVVFQTKYAFEGLEQLKYVDPFKEIKVIEGENSKLLISLEALKPYRDILSQDQKILTVIFPGSTLQGKKILLDPGHGGIDPGAVGPTGFTEKEVNLKTGLKLKEFLELSGAEVILTRATDVQMSLSSRSYQANTSQADIFVSIHANASTSSSSNGTKTFYYAPSSNSKLYAQLTQRKKLAEVVQAEMVKALGRKDSGTGQENFSVLRETNMPSILVETAFISNPEEEQLLRSEEFQEKAAWAMANGIVAYFQQ